MVKRKDGALTYGRKEKLAGGTEARYNPGASVDKAGFWTQIQCLVNPRDAPLNSHFGTLNTGTADYAGDGQRPFCSLNLRKTNRLGCWRQSHRRRKCRPGSPLTDP